MIHRCNTWHQPPPGGCCTGPLGGLFTFCRHPPPQTSSPSIITISATHQYHPFITILQQIHPHLPAPPCLVPSLLSEILTPKNLGEISLQKPLAPTLMCVCARACVRVCVRVRAWHACICVCMHVCARACTCVRVCVCVCVVNRTR